MLKFISTLLAIVIASFSQAAQLIIEANPSDGVQREAFNVKIHEFRRAYPDINVTLNIYEHEEFKQRVEAHINDKPAIADLLFWFGGASLKHFADQQWIQPITELWQAENWNDAFSASSKQAVTRDKEQYGLPIYYYQWGIYYRKSIFYKYKLRPPQTWDELLNLGRKLNQNNIKPFTIGTKDYWPAAGWFDYLNLRINGLQYHESLLKGCIPFTDNGVKQVFKHWQELIQNNFFFGHTDQLTWKDALPYIYHGKAAMLLMGNFFLSSVPETLRNDIGFFPFPIINPEIKIYEVAPTDVLIMPKHSENREDAETFFKFMAQAKNQSGIASSLGMIPPNRFSTLPDDEKIRQGFDLLNQAQGLTQFFDRDTHPLFSKQAMPLFVEFMNAPDKLNTILIQLEQARLQVWPKKCKKAQIPAISDQN